MEQSLVHGLNTFFFITDRSNCTDWMSSLRNIVNKYIENVYKIFCYTQVWRITAYRTMTKMLLTSSVLVLVVVTDLVSRYKCCDHLATTEAGMRPHQWRNTVAGPGPGATSVPVIRFSGGGYCLHHWSRHLHLQFCMLWLVEDIYV